MTLHASASLVPWLLPLQVDFDPVPWWLPVVVIAAGVLLCGVPYVNVFIENRFPEWRSLPALPQVAVVGLLISGAALVVFAQLGQSDWMYVLFLFTYTRAIEGATILHLFGRIDEIARMIAASGDGGGGSMISKLKQILSWVVQRFLKRLPLTIVTTVLLILSVVLFIAVLIGFPGAPITVRVAAVMTVVTFSLSTVNTAWILRKVTDELGPAAFLGVVCCVVGGELYNVPAALSLFPNVPAVDGPFGAWTTVTVGLVGWFVGLLLALLFFTYRIRQTDPKIGSYSDFQG